MSSYSGSVTLKMFSLWVKHFSSKNPLETLKRTADIADSSRDVDSSRTERNMRIVVNEGMEDGVFGGRHVVLPVLNLFIYIVFFEDRLNGVNAIKVEHLSYNFKLFS